MNWRLWVSVLFFIKAFLLDSFFVQAQISTIGRDFYIGFMDNNRRNTQPDRVVVIITAVEKAAGTIQTPKQSIPFTLEPGEQLMREFDGDNEGVIHRESGRVDYKPFRITSSGDLTVHAINGREYSTDGTVILPTSALSTEYLVMAHYDTFGPGQEPGSNQNFESTLLVVATENDTQVEVIPAAPTVNTIPAGAPIQFTLDAGESYQIKANGDLTGSRVRVLNPSADSCKLLAVFGGNKTSSAGDCGTSGDHIFQQAYPLESWDKEYIHVPLAGRTSGEIIKVLASQDGTEVRINGTVRATLDAREYVRFEFGKNELALIETSKPSSVAVIAKSGACNEFGVAPLGDPSLFLLSPNSQRLKNITFSTGKLIGSFNQSIEHFLTILVPSGSEGETLLNRVNVGGQFQPALATGFSYARIKVPFGVNTLSNPEGFIAYVYGSGSIESYGFAVGASLENVQYETETTYDFDVVGEKVACLNQEGTWEIFPDDSRFKDFTWDFGDGSELKDGKSVSHTYTSSGSYEVLVFASTGEGSCDSETKFSFEIDVTVVEAELEGPSSLCPDSGGIPYRLENMEGVSEVIWEVSGGIYSEVNDFEILVDWGAANPDALVRAIPVAENGCLGPVLEIFVALEDDFSPEKPEGQLGICGTDTGPFTYSIPFPQSGKEYQWYVVGGDFVSSNEGELVEVNWDLNAPVRSVFYEERIPGGGSCFGTSEVLEIGFFPVLDAKEGELISPSCSGNADGKIALDVQGGSGEFSFSWSHDPNLDEAIATGLSPGNYEVTVTDLLGCGQQTLNFIITDPEPISIVSESIVQPSCNENNDGEIVLEVQGGSPPFQVPGYDTDWDGEFLTVFGIGLGDYELFVADQNDCGITYSGQMDAPATLEIEFEEITPGCPGGIDGSIRVLIQGGTPPYQILWENGFTGDLLTNLSSGIYEVSITDANGCKVSGAGRVSEARPSVRMPNGFLPSDGPYQPISNCSISYELFVFDRWGQMIFSGSEGWNGLFKGESMPTGVYTYLLRYQYSLDTGIQNDQLTGAFTLID
ncbi:PKD domain-containing protein [Algoriphagus kandeliae]|uniref:PKD domain-containing protein n=1 Tax=Algoriphagus kandeliae TaxID=2562278 RepID=A0A4Y9QPJ9_9BACT|nr:PKD domain-containing protein [Algoriphagus kandeliae]TFV94107.1 PKD domain-containing protein [Algoriphagus kandeliae]